MSRSRIITGARVLVYVNGKPFAQVTHFRWDSATPPKKIMGVDSGEPVELAPTTTMISGNMGLLRLSGDGGLEGAGIIPEFSEVPRGKYFSLALIDRATDTQIFRADRCWCASQSWDIPSKGMVTGQMTFEALGWNNEATKLP